MLPAVFLDRDGVLNSSLLDSRGLPIPPRRPDEFCIPDDVPLNCARLRLAGFALICITNQPDIARGLANPNFINWVNDQVQNACDLECVLTCPHDDRDNCHCRKPKPGLIYQGAAALNIDLARSFVVGDRYRDIEAGQAAGVRTVLLDYGYPERAPREPPDFVARNFAEATTWLLAQTK
jgi:D-glycero-D-manno-heptose 1,7-bisphosphate phosphatase